MTGVKNVRSFLSSYLEKDNSLGGHHLLVGEWPTLVTKFCADTPIADVILGHDFLRRQRCDIEMKDSSDILHVQSHGQSVAIARNKTVDSACGFNVILQESVVVPPCSEIEVMDCTSDIAKQKTWILQGKESKQCAVMVGRALVEPEGNQIPVHLLNPRDVEFPVSKGTTLAELESIPEGHAISALSQEFEIEPSPEHRRKLWEMVEGAKQSLSHEEKAKLFALLLEYHTLLATGDDDLGLTAKVQHKIDTANSLPIHQSVRRMLQLRRQEAKKLLDDMLADQLYSLQAVRGLHL